MKFAAAILAYAFISANAEDLMTDEIKKGFVDAHNKYRSLVENPFPKEMPALVWDDYVAFKAQDWANGCLQAHSPDSYRQYDDTEFFGTSDSYMGENLYMSSNKPTPDQAIKKFYDEYVYYDYYTKTSTGITGHYTQVVWANTKRVGCGMAYCPNSSFKYFVVCEYYPGGNYVGRRPYVNSTQNCTTCAAVGFECGEFTDNCGNKVVCNSCKTSERCENNKCVCYPKTVCAENDCGVVSDGCGGTITCGGCKYPGQTCNTKGKCTCTNRRTCYGLNKNCGVLDDGCGGNMTCGVYPCSGENECRDNVCTCPNGTTCADLGYECGYVENGCGRNLTCGTCYGDATCVDHVCVRQGMGSDDSIAYRDPEGACAGRGVSLVALVVLAIIAAFI